MKKPENFSAGATKKTTDPIEESINGMFLNQQVQKENPKSSVLLENSEINQINQNSFQNIQNLEENRAEEGEKSQKSTVRREVKEKFLVSMSKGERAIYKSFCALKGVSMNHFVMCAMDYFKEDLESGKVSISSHSYKRARGNE